MIVSLFSFVRRGKLLDRHQGHKGVTGVSETN